MDLTRYKERLDEKEQTEAALRNELQHSHQAQAMVVGELDVQLIEARRQLSEREADDTLLAGTVLL